MLPPAVTNGDVILIVVIAALPVAALFFILGAGKALSQIGKGQFAIDREFPAPGSAGQEAPISPADREAEIRQLLEAKSYRAESRGEAPLDVEAELERLLAEQKPSRLGADKQLREEVRQLAVARNERRVRQGKEPLDLEEEIERQLRDLENLGQ